MCTTEQNTIRYVDRKKKKKYKNKNNCSFIEKGFPEKKKVLKKLKSFSFNEKGAPESHHHYEKTIT